MFSDAAITRELFDQQRRPRFGVSNPEKMNFAFWRWMIRGDGLHQTEGGGLSKAETVIRGGVLKSAYGPYRARDLFQVPTNREDGPIWTFDRMGRTTTKLEDGRVICIGGEHEDFYDPDFYIYNDVVELTAEKDFSIYGYPQEDFPPTDFHSATLAKNRIIIIGGLGYKNSRRFGFTPVYSLDLSDFHIDAVETSGEMPGWIHKHEATLDGARTITIRNGTTVLQHDSEQLFLRNFEDYSLDLKSGVWRRASARKYHQFRIRREDKEPFPLKPYEKAKSLLPLTIAHSVAECDWRSARLLIRDAEITLEVGFNEIVIVVKGVLPEQIERRVCEEILMNAQTSLQSKCSLQRL